MKNGFQIMFLSSVLFLIIASCNNDCPPNEYWGKKDLSATVKTFQPDIANKILIFADSANNEIKLKASNIENGYGEGGITLCQSGEWIFIDAAYGIIDYERIRWSLTNVDSNFFKVSFEIGFGTNLIGSERNVDTTGIFYERLWVEHRFSPGNGSADILNDYYLYNRNNPISNYEPPRFIGDTTIMSRNFENVFEITKFGDKTYYNKELGLLVLRDKNRNPLILDRIE